MYMQWQYFCLGGGGERRGKSINIEMVFDSYYSQNINIKIII